MGEAHDFLAAVTASSPDDQWGYLWTPGGEGEDRKPKSFWFQLDDLDPIVELGTSLSAQSDVYFGVSTSSKRGPANRRVRNDTASGAYAVVADVDIRNPEVHKKLNLPESEAEAMEVLRSGGLDPTVVVHSGNGLHAWWVFGDYWSFGDEGQRQAYATLSQQWHATIRVRAAERGWINDSVFDIARVLRLPGTLNHKTDPPKPARLLVCDPGRTYDAGDFAEHFIDDAEMRSISLPVSRTYVVDDLTFDPDARANQDKVDTLRAIDDRFAGAMDRNRPEFKDQSPSTYDLSLATIATQAGWSDQEILDLLISCRRQHGEDLKLKNQQYYRRTIIKAREVTERERAVEEVSEKVEELREAATSSDEEAATDARRDVLNTISALLGLEFTAAYRYTSDPPEFAVVIGGHMVHLGVWENVEAMAKMRSRIHASNVAMAFPRLKAPQWDQVVHALRQACVDQDVGEESTEQGAMGAWLVEYLMDRPPVSDPVEAARSQYPFFNQVGRIGIFSKPFGRWVFTSRGERLDTRRLGRIMRQMGCSTTQVNVNGATTVQAWILPASLSQSISYDPASLS